MHNGQCKKMGFLKMAILAKWVTAPIPDYLRNHLEHKNVSMHHGISIIRQIHWHTARVPRVPHSAKIGQNRPKIAKLDKSGNISTSQWCPGEVDISIQTSLYGHKEKTLTSVRFLYFLKFSILKLATLKSICNISIC